MHKAWRWRRWVWIHGFGFFSSTLFMNAEEFGVTVNTFSTQFMSIDLFLNGMVSQWIDSG
jgi:hypothetical protein